MGQLLAVGFKIASRYSVQALLGKGGMGAVYLAMDEALERKVAIKVLHPAISDDKQYIARFEREAKIVAQLSINPHVVSVYDLGVLDSGIPYLVMEYLPGKNLRDLIADYSRPSRTFVLDVGKQVASALWDAHSQGVVHRDLKPENIFFVQLPTIPLLVKVLDFGIARSDAIILSPDFATAHGTFMGTPFYIAPEQALGKPVPQSDIFSLGVLLYELASGTLPYEADTHLGHILQHINIDAKPLPLYQDTSVQWPPMFSELLLAMMSREPQKRPSARETLIQLSKVDEQIEQEKARLLQMS